ncbi:NEDD4 family-interacting protein 1-like isoform X1 [Paramormyrops kingsleyae]|uniref:NEDD4 family-interacting protein 1-like isoform X2 n=2 Tax=Paramormyrops kingsleyae TaxID=1676925 RepID=UPI003B97C3A7
MYRHRPISECTTPISRQARLRAAQCYCCCGTRDPCCLVQDHSQKFWKSPGIKRNCCLMAEQESNPVWQHFTKPTPGKARCNICSRLLHNEDDPSEASSRAEASTSSHEPPLAEPTLSVDVEAPPPPYASIATGATAAPEVGFQGDFPVPPPYSVATSLPTYDEAEKAKAAAMAAAAVEVAQREEEFSPREDFSDADQLRVGNDGIFMLAFFMAFLFNWIGFCLSFCLTNTIAGRYGAICGFGLSLIKWILIVRFSDYFTGYFNGQYWLWWIFLVLGLLLFFRGFVNYLKVRNMSESMAASHRTRFLFTY